MISASHARGSFARGRRRHSVAAPMSGFALCTCLLAASPSKPTASSRHLHSRRSVLAGAATALATPLGASAVVRGDSVDNAEAAATGSVGLWIDLTDCSVCRKNLPATCSGTLIAPDLVLSVWPHLQPQPAPAAAAPPAAPPAAATPLAAAAAAAPTLATSTPTAAATAAAAAAA